MIIIIKIGGNIIDTNDIANELTLNQLESDIINKMSESSNTYSYNSLNQLKFELDLRQNIINASLDLANSRFRFEVFKESECNPDFWERTAQGGFLVKPNVSPYDAINDIFKNGAKYATECSTAIVIVYYGGLIKMYPKELFDRVFAGLHLYNWHYIDSDLDIRTRQSNTGLPGDCRYFKNPEFDTETPEWQGENAIDLGNNKYYGHGMGIKTAENIINILNQNRIPNPTESAYLTDSITNPNYKHLYELL